MDMTTCETCDKPRCETDPGPFPERVYCDCFCQGHPKPDAAQKTPDGTPFGSKVPSYGTATPEEAAQYATEQGFSSLGKLAELTRRGYVTHERPSGMTEHTDTPEERARCEECGNPGAWTGGRLDQQWKREFVKRFFVSRLGSTRDSNAHVGAHLEAIMFIEYVLAQAWLQGYIARIQEDAGGKAASNPYL